jgi:ribokinase
MKTFDLIAVGDTTEDIFLELDQETKIVKDEKGDAYLGLRNAEKIVVEKLTDVLAVGNSANVAVGVSRLGLRSALYTHLGKDDAGEEMVAVLAKEKVAKDYIVFDKEKRSNLSVVLNYKAERTILVYHEHRKYSLPPALAPAAWMYFSSLGEGHEKLHKQIPAYIKKHKVKMGFNPGSHQMNEGIVALRPILKVTEVLFVNKDEAQTLVGKSDSIQELMQRLHKEGPKIVAITDGPKGSYASDGNNIYFLDIFPAPLVERTGAGDSFATGFISALFHKKPVPEAMQWGTINSAFVIQKIGAQKGLLKKQEMEKLVSKNKKFQATKI